MIISVRFSRERDEEGRQHTICSHMDDKKSDFIRVNFHKERLFFFKYYFMTVHHQTHFVLVLKDLTFYLPSS